ncbi:MAG: 6-phosphogluconolactonase [Bacteroidales bacterium]|nr:6-phosphogluconolactonase [Bacteroidales bacterium]MCF8457758.1 6-phosphogluconolactonase [Bacteroidales bacterium]
MKTNTNFTRVEKKFQSLSGHSKMGTKMPYIAVDNFPRLGMFAALRFIEWVLENPQGVISLPTGKTPEHFIKWTQHIIHDWGSLEINNLCDEYGINKSKKPNLSHLKFVQIDEFYPISSQQQNSFAWYVKEFYIKGFGLNPENALLINAEQIPLVEGARFQEIFPDLKVDLSLRYREAKTAFEKKQQESILLIDNWCSEYEQKIRDLGGIGFFLGGIGPDGHIAFNTRGSDHYSTTRLTETNFETQAVAAGDLGGIEISRNRLVITIGLQTITFNPDAVAIIIAAGEAKADVVKNALERKASNEYPATVLHKLKNGRFYVTKSAASKLDDFIEAYFQDGEWSFEKTERAIIDLCVKNNIYGHHLKLRDLQEDRWCSMIPSLSESTVAEVIESVKRKIEKGREVLTNQNYYHTGPHHDDIMLGLFPHISHELRGVGNSFTFSVLTSGFTAVTNQFIRSILRDAKAFIQDGQIQMLKYADFFQTGHLLKRDKDVYHYLNKVASGEPIERTRGVSHRVVRDMVELYSIKSVNELIDKIDSILTILDNSYDGQKNPVDIQNLKGRIREFEEELVWAHFGVQVKNIKHLRLKFYTGDIFTEQPERSRDVIPILEELRRTKPTIVSLALDPEGSGPDTHYKVLQAIADAVRLWSDEADLSHLKIYGYRNVWYRFHPAEAEVIVPVSLNSLSSLDNAFTNCYLSQVDASFPSYMLDGRFSQLAQRIWIEQLKQIQLLLGKNYFYENDRPRLRGCHGLVFFKEMDVKTFLSQARELAKSVEGDVK